MMPKIRDRLAGLLRAPANLPDPINDPDVRRPLAEDLDRAPLYWINDEFTKLVIDVTDDQPPAPITDSIIPSASGLLAWPRPVGRNSRLEACSWRPLADGWHILGYRVPELLLPAVIFPGLTFAALYLWPMIDKRLTGDRDEHHLLDRARHHPLARSA